MPHPFPMASVFTEGMRRDVDRTMLPGGSVYNLVDFIPDELSVPVGGRGGWTYSSGALSGATQIKGLGIAPSGWYSSYPNGVVVAIDQSPKAWDAIAGTSFTGATVIPGSPGAFHRGFLFFPTNPSNPASLPTAFNGTSIVSLSAGAPNATLAGVYKDHALLANATPNHVNRIWFSAAGDPTTWDLNFGWWDTTESISAIGTTVNSILLFHPDYTERLRGTTPPPGSDMTLEPFFNDGCIDPFSVAYWQQNVVFASSRGIYLTDGNTITDLTADAQMKSYWTSLVSGYTSSWRVAGGIYRGHYIVSVNNGSTLVDCLCVNLNTHVIWRFSNLHGSSFGNLTFGQEKLYMGQWNAGRVAELSSLWTPGASVKQDGDGTNPTPIIETGSFRGWDRLHRRWIQSMGLQKWRFAYVDYDLRDSASDNPTMTLSYAKTPTGAYTTVAGGNLPKSTDYIRKRRSFNTTIGGAIRSNMLNLKLAVNGPYASAKVYSIEAAFEPIESGALD